MAAPAPRRLSRCLPALLLPALLATSAPRAAEDAAAGDPPKLAIAVDPETTGSLPPFPARALRDDDAPDLGAIRTAIAAYRRGALADGDASAGQIDAPAIRTLLEWVAIQSNGGRVSFTRIEAFLKAHPDHPSVNRFRRRAEEALLSERKSPAVVRAFLQCRQPLSQAGRVALALALKAEGKSDDALALARRSWR